MAHFGVSITQNASVTTFLDHFKVHRIHLLCPIKKILLADIHSCSDLLLASTNYTEENFPEVVKGDEFLNLTREEVCYLISSDQLSVGSEERVFESVINWVRHDVQSRKKCLPDLLEHVRMPLLSKG